MQTKRKSPDDDRLIRGAEVCERFGNVSRMSIVRWMRDFGFPEPTKINGRNYWRLGDLRRWQAEQTAK